MICESIKRESPDPRQWTCSSGQSLQSAGRAPGVILTGMGQDGLQGCEALCVAGSSVIVQDEASSVVWGMPGFVARAGFAEKILPLDQIGKEIICRVTAQTSFRLTHQN